MNHPILFEYRTVKPHQIDPLNAKFCFRYSLEDPELEQSVAKFGLLTPLTVIALEGERYGLVAGFKRLYAALKLKHEALPIQITPAMNEGELLHLALENNRSSAYKPLDQAVAVVNLKSNFNIGEKEIAQKILPLLGLAPSQKVLEEIEVISNLEANILQAVGREEIPARGIAVWGEFSAEEQTLLWENFLKRFHFTSSELLETGELIRDLIKMKNFPLKDFLKLPEIGEVLNTSSNQKTDVLIQALKRMRFPKSYEIRKSFKENLSRLKFKNPIQINKSESMEDEGIELKVRLAKKESLGKVIEELKQKQNEIERLIEL